MQLTPEQAEYLDMVIQDCRGYLMQARGDSKAKEAIENEPPATDPKEVVIRMKRLKDQCIRAAGREPLKWESSPDSRSALSRGAD